MRTVKIVLMSCVEAPNRRRPLNSHIEPEAEAFADQTVVVCPLWSKSDQESGRHSGTQGGRPAAPKLLLRLSAVAAPSGLGDTGAEPLSELAS